MRRISQGMQETPGGVSVPSYPTQFPHLTQLLPLLPNPQLLHSFAGKLVDPTHLPHFAQLSALLPKPQLLHSFAGKLVDPTQFPHLTQLSALLPNPQLLQSLAAIPSACTGPPARKGARSADATEIPAFCKNSRRSMVVLLFMMSYPFYFIIRWMERQ
jgi:hypothetical protein